MITLHFPKYIRELTDGKESQQFDTQDIATIISGLRTLFPNLSLYLTGIDSGQVNNICYLVEKDSKKIVTNTISGKTNATELVLLITLYGQGEDLGGILLGVALVAAGFVLGPSVSLIGVSGVLTGQSLITAGLAIGLTSFLGLFKQETQQANTPSDSPIRANNDAFGSLQNTTSTDMAIPLIFGQMRVSGQFVGGRIRTINHNAGDVISLVNYV